MSDKFDCLFTLQQILIERFTAIPASGYNLPAAQTFQTLVLTANVNSLDDGMYAIIKPFYEPLSSKFRTCVQTLNGSIENATGLALPVRAGPPASDRMSAFMGCFADGMFRRSQVGS